MTKIGITATQYGLTRKQAASARLLLERLAGQAQSLRGTREAGKDHRTDGEVELHHGVCVGGDAQVHRIAQTLGLAIIGHPPTDQYKMVRHLDGFARLIEPAPYTERNEQIVTESDLLIACPRTFDEQLRSGTWATVRRAQAAGKPVWFIYPDGRIEAPLEPTSK